MEETYQLPLPQIVEKFGEEDFLNKEAALIISETSSRDHIVISPGGSVIYRQTTMEHLKDISQIIYLKVPQEILEQRIGNIPRGIVGIGPRSFSDIYHERTVLYERWCDHTILGDADPDVVVKNILDAIDG